MEEIEFVLPPDSEPPLEDYLKELYPDKTQDEIEYFIKMIEEHSTEALPPTSEMIRIVDVRRQIKALETEEAQLKEKIILQKKRLGIDFQLVKVTPSTSHYFQEDKFYDFVSTLVSKRLLNEITDRTINIEKFKKLVAEKKISYNQLPPEIYKATESYRITTPRK